MWLIWILVPLALYFALAGWATFLRGPFRFAYNPHIAPLVRRQGADGTTVGARCYVGHPNLIAEFPNGFEPVHLPYHSPARRWWRHEKGHNHQWRVRPLMAPVYVFWELLVGWQRNPLEIESRREEDRPEHGQ